MIILEQSPSLDFSYFWRGIPKVLAQIPLSWWIGFVVLFVTSALLPEPVRRRSWCRRW